ncbi:MAG: RHH-type proline utilization regulon transcriptional repressor/proline dehydrogenase [Pseudohongiellaceae bacterium]|jgi:RHH-type proline utilization regulon transcriptional repressor/proline dehydrogenase/delta 1-pyrroline-5-carboxylate dehydrogenase
MKIEISSRRKIDLRNRIEEYHLADESWVLEQLGSSSALSIQQRKRISERALELIEYIRYSGKPGMMDQFLSEYGLSTNEGIALMCLAESMLRVPDSGTIDTLINDKITPFDWIDHLGKSEFGIINAATIGLLLTGRVLDEDNSSSITGLLNRTVKRIGEPVVRTAVRQAMKEMGNQFVLGQTIQEALERAKPEIAKGYLYSFDMLGEAALTKAAADAYFESYARAIEAISSDEPLESVITRPGISVKLSAIHPRFEYSQAERLKRELVPRLISLCQLAKKGGIALTVDAEEANRLEPLLDVVEMTLEDESLAGWDGFGVVIQAYGKRAVPVIEWLNQLAQELNRKVSVRLVKGAYWDAEIKTSQVIGAEDYPVFTSKTATDIAYVCCAKKLFEYSERIYPQFATHNAQTAATILELAGDCRFEFQRLHGMGESLYNHLISDTAASCRIYAPVGPHEDLLAYLVRRLLENGANSSFVNQINDKKLPSKSLAVDPFEKFEAKLIQRPSNLPLPEHIYQPSRLASRGWDTSSPTDVASIARNRAAFLGKFWAAHSLLSKPQEQASVSPCLEKIVNPANYEDIVGEVLMAKREDLESALAMAKPWTESTANERALVLFAAADSLEQNSGELFALLCRESGKTLSDAVAELREAVDFLRYYANQCQIHEGGAPRGVICCISPWNFPLAIFTGQIAAALSAGNAVVAKPSEFTPLIAYRATELLLQAGVPANALQLVQGTGKDIGQAIVSDKRVAGVCFTGSMQTAQAINQAMAENLSPDAMLIAETGGLNAAIIDSTALLEQAVRDTIVSAFQSAGQRCSALRMLYVQEDIANDFLKMLCGAMDELVIGGPDALHTDVGPVISQAAKEKIEAHIADAKAHGKLIKQLRAPTTGSFVGPALIQADGIQSLHEEIFGPVLHVARFAAKDFEQVLEEVNRSGYGLTFGLHTRISQRADSISRQLKVGNIYINRNQIGAVVETQPFGGEGLSGTGPKAGGPHYIRRFYQSKRRSSSCAEEVRLISTKQVQSVLDDAMMHSLELLYSTEMPGPTGESNTLDVWPRGVVLCLGPTAEDAYFQAGAARSFGCPAVVCAPEISGHWCLDGELKADQLADLEGIDVVAFFGSDEDASKVRKTLAKRRGCLIPLSVSEDMHHLCILERHTCVNTTASGGNTTLLSSTQS